MAVDSLDTIIDIEEENFIQESETILDDIQAGLVSNYLKTELDEVASDAGRVEKMQRITKIRRQRVAQPENASKDTPWENASNVSPPLLAQKVNTVTSRINRAFIQRDPLFKFTATKDFKEHAQAVTRHIQKLVENPGFIDMYKKLWPMNYDLTSEGTLFAKVPFVLDRLLFKRQGENGGNETVDRIIKATPDVIKIPFEDFFTRSEWPDLQKAPWVGVRYYKFDHEVRRLAQQGFYTNVEAILQNDQVFNAHREQMLKDAGVEISSVQEDTNRMYEIFEVNLFWDTDGDGVAEDIIVHFERESSTILRVEYNELSRRDYVRIPYLDIPNIIYGLGVGDLVTSLQDEIETLHNMRIDGSHLAMLPFIVAQEGSNFGKNIKIKPGQIVKTTDPKNDFIMHKFPDVSIGALQGESVAKDYADKASGASDMMAGFEPGGSNRIGATGTQFLTEQGNTFLQAVMDNIERGYAEIGMLLLYQLVRNSDQVDLSILSETDQELCRQVYSMNVEDIPLHFKFKVETTPITQTSDGKKQMSIGLMQIYMTYGDKIMQIVSQLSNPQIQQLPQLSDVLNTYYIALTKFMDKIIQDFDTEDAAAYLPFIKDIELQMEAMDAARSEEVDRQSAGVNDAVSNAPGGSGMFGGTKGTAAEFMSSPGGTNGTGDQQSEGSADTF
jgi:hypothetical protein